MTKHTTRGVLYRHRTRPGKVPVGARIIMVLGELAMTAGALVGLFIFWVLYVDSPYSALHQLASAASLSQKLLNDSSHGAQAVGNGVPIPPRVENYHDMAVLYIPRFGQDYKRVIRESVDVSRVLNSLTAGVGHYPESAMPGQVGNFAIAGHDVGWGKAFGDVPNLELGDHIYVMTKTGWYIYTYRNSEYVTPQTHQVLLPVPQVADAPPKDRLLTMTTCNPPFSIDERLIAYAVFDRWQPLSDVPAELAHVARGV